MIKIKHFFLLSFPVFCFKATLRLWGVVFDTNETGPVATLLAVVTY